MPTPSFSWDSSVNKSVLARYDSVTGLPVFLDDTVGIPVEITSTNLTTPTIYNVTMTDADTEYSQVLPANTRLLEFRCQDLGVATRFAYETGKVATPTAPYRVLGAGEVKTLEGLNLVSKTLYFACASAGKIMEIECWT